jgi:hypothetical protein
MAQAGDGVGGKQSGPRRGRRPWHVRELSVFKEPGDLASGRAASPPMSGRRGAVAGDEQTREVTLRHSSCEADEQSRATTGGAKGGDRGKRGKGRYARTPDREGVSYALYCETESGKGKPPGNRVKAIPPAIPVASAELLQLSGPPSVAPRVRNEKSVTGSGVL